MWGPSLADDIDAGLAGVVAEEAVDLLAQVRVHSGLVVSVEPARDVLVVAPAWTVDDLAGFRLDQQLIREDIRVLGAGDVDSVDDDEANRFAERNEKDADRLFFGFELAQKAIS